MSGGTHFYRPVVHAGSMVVKNVEREQAIRLYCEQSGTAWLLQVRGPQRLGFGGREGKAFMVAGATLTRDDMVALREAIDALLAEP